MAFDQRLPILETNTMRLHARLLAIQGNLMCGEVNVRLWKFAEEVLPRTGSGKFNQALMDLGSLVCTSKSPKCTKCPVVVFCESAKQGRQTAIPTPKPKEQGECRIEVALLVRKRGKTLLIRYPDGQRWAGLWDFPRVETTEVVPQGLSANAALQESLLELTGHKLIPGRLICSLKHSVTKYQITLLCCEGTDAGKSDKKPLCETRWATAAELQELPLNSTARKLVQTVLLVNSWGKCTKTTFPKSLCVEKTPTFMIQYPFVQHCSDARLSRNNVSYDSNRNKSTPTI